MVTEKVLERTVISAIAGSQLEILKTETKHYFVQRKIGHKPKFISIDEGKYNKILEVLQCNG